MSKVIMVVIDGLGFETAVRELGFLEGLVEAGQARRWAMRSVLPSLSLPIYETLHTGVAPAEHGITSNDTRRASAFESVFSVARAHGKTTAAAAYSWYSELYNGVPFDPVMDREQDDAPGAIRHGRYYIRDDFPDAELYWNAAALVRRHAPDYLLVHPMGCDHLGHLHGGESIEYRRAAAGSDDLLAQYLPEWRAAGYRVIVTADHGMCPDGHHGGTIDAVRRVPFYLVGGADKGGVEAEVVDQLRVAPTVLSLMELPRPATMTAAPLA